MLGNRVNRHDAARVARKLSRGQAGHILEKVRIRGTDRVVAHWAAVDPSLQQWWAIPQVEKRWNTFASGDPAVSFPEHVAKTWLADRSGLRALSLGCGTGGNEVIWARLGVFEEVTGIDISPNRIDHATREAKELGLDSVLKFRVADASQLLREAEEYDVVLGLQSLHHFEKLDETMDLIASLLGPDGLLIFDEFVGPTRFQWTRAQLRAANALLHELPPERRVLIDGRLKRTVVRPSLLSMRLDDPSEAVEAGNLLPALRRRFDVLEERPYGGTVLHITFSGIAQNFLDDRPETAELLEKCFSAEDKALPELGHDFIFAVCKPKTDMIPSAAGA
jgi:2-polyprenyl-3-methyl-5-hydroxy-6-metoxy-1,4-benzoquinol methylase